MRRLQRISATGLIVDSQDRILVIKRSDNDDFLPGVWVFPGGGVDYQEEPEEALKREILEECGIEVEISHPLTTFSYMMPSKQGEKHAVEIIYLCTLANDQKVNLSFEHSDFKWISFSEISQIHTTDLMNKLFTRLEKHPLIANKRKYDTSIRRSH